MRFVDPRPDVSIEALQALNDDFLYFNVAGSGPTFPIAQRAAESYRTWMNGVGMFSHVGYDSYNAELSETRADLARFIGDADGASRIALTQSATVFAGVMNGKQTLQTAFKNFQNVLVNYAKAQGFTVSTG